MNTTPLQIYPAMCEQQCQDLDTLLKAVDDFGAMSLALTGHGAQSYTSFIEARDAVRKLIVDISKNYRLVA